jgi:homoserine dehydrogenase
MTQHTYDLTLIGFGNVGQGLAQIMAERETWLAEHFDVAFRILAVSDLRLGNAYNPGGLDPVELLAAVEGGRGLMEVPGAREGWDAEEAIPRAGADVVVEMSPTDLGTGEPALTYVRRALELGMHVVTTNKGPTALRFPELRALAKERGVRFGVEGTVLSGTPALRLGAETLRLAGIRKVVGILNGTTNYILSQMEAGAPYADALREAQEKGYAEADPRGDVEGYDAAGKVVILANLLMDLPLTMQDVDRQGITHLSPGDIASAREEGMCWKLIGAVERSGQGGFRASVGPTRLPQEHPLAIVGGVMNAITYTTDLLGEITLIGPGAGRVETGFAVLSDLISILHIPRD